MKRMILVLVLVLSVALGGTLDYSLAAKAAGPDYGLGAHFQARTAFVQKFLPQDALAKAMPPAPHGWTVREGRLEDGVAVRGLPVDPVELAASQEVADALQGLQGMEFAQNFYHFGDEAIYLDISFIPANARQTRLARLSNAMYAALIARSGAPVEDTGLAIHGLSEPEFAPARVYLGVIGEGAIYFSALSSADEGTVLDLLNGIDLAALHQMIAEDPTIGAAPVEEEALPEAPEKTSPCTSRGAAKFCGTGG